MHGNEERADAHSYYEDPIQQRPEVPPFGHAAFGLPLFLALAARLLTLNNMHVCSRSEN